MNKWSSQFLGKHNPMFWQPLSVHNYVDIATLVNLAARSRLNALLAVFTKHFTKTLGAEGFIATLLYQVVFFAHPALSHDAILKRVFYPFADPIEPPVEPCWYQ